MAAATAEQVALVAALTVWQELQIMPVVELRLQEELLEHLSTVFLDMWGQNMPGEIAAMKAVAEAAVGGAVAAAATTVAAVAVQVMWLH